MELAHKNFIFHFEPFFTKGLFSGYDVQKITAHKYFKDQKIILRVQMDEKTTKNVKVTQKITMRTNIRQ